MPQIVAVEKRRRVQGEIALKGHWAARQQNIWKKKAYFVHAPRWCVQNGNVWATAADCEWYRLIWHGVNGQIHVDDLIDPPITASRRVAMVTHWFMGGRRWGTMTARRASCHYLAGNCAACSATWRHVLQPDGWCASSFEFKSFKRYDLQFRWSII